jgi:mannan endo-1,4-beta-mannosidase
MRRLPIVLAGLAVAALLAYVAAVVLRSGSDSPPTGAGPTEGPGPSATPAAPPTPFPPDGKTFLGVQTATGPHDLTPLDAFAAATGHQPSVLQFSSGWADDRFDRAQFDRIAQRRMLPILAWEPWDHTAVGEARSRGAQPDYRLSRIATGAFDDYIRSWAAGIKDLGYPVGIRFAHEMNGFWYPWCEQSNGNARGDYVKAYRHVHELFVEAGADNVIWIWSPNVTYPGAEPLKGLYPGDDYVDWIGLSGYYGTEGVQSYRSFNQIFTRTFDELRRFTERPIVITETGATDSDGAKARFVREMFAQLPDHPDVIGVIWFELRNDVDWRIATAPAAAREFGKGARHDRYAAPWSTNTTPRTKATASR